MVSDETNSRGVESRPRTARVWVRKGLPSGSAVVFLFFIALCVQTVSLLPSEALSAALKPFHIIGLLLIGRMVLRGRVPIMPLGISLFAFGVFVSLVWTYKWGLSTVLANYIFAFLVLLLGIYHVRRYGRQTTHHALRLATGVVFIAIVIKLGLYWDSVMAFHANPYGHPSLPYILAGGPNLESTWLTLSTMFFIGSPPVFMLLLLLSGMISVAYASRIGLILAVLALSIFGAHHALRRGALNFAILSIVLPLVIAVSIFFVGDTYLFERFNQIGSDPGSMGRIRLWSASAQAILEYPLGTGPGNAVKAARSVSGMELPEDNVHNLFLQTTLDFGILVGALWMLITLTLVAREFRNGFRNPFGAFLVLYVAASVLQFRGAEPIAWYIAGIYFVTRERLDPVRRRPL